VTLINFEVLNKLNLKSIDLWEIEDPHHQQD